MNADVLSNRFKVLGALGEGAMGRVLLVDDGATGQEVALKVISRAFGVSEKSSRLQMKQEFRMMTQLRHPNCCAVYDYGILPAGAPFFSMEVVPGHGLDEILPLPADRLRDVLGQLLLALGYVHGLGLVHRDIKSANVRLRPDGVVKLMDFGLMAYEGRTGDTISGTPAYLSPEAIKRGPVDRRSDLYSVGVLAYELITGQLPFRKNTAIELIRAHVGEAPVPPSRVIAGVDPAIERVVMKLLAKEPGERFGSAFDVLEALGFPVPPTIGGRLFAPPLTGREAELAKLGALIDRIVRGVPGGTILIEGASGIGKSRLVDELRWQVQLAEMPCGTGGLAEQGGAPYAPIVAALRRLAPIIREVAPAVLDEHAPILVELLPELGVARAPAMDTPEKQKRRLQWAIAATLLHFARIRPTVLVIEDWQWADPLSAECVTYLGGQLADVPVAIVVTTRPIESPPVLDTTLTLAPLDEAGVQRIIRAMLDSDAIDPTFVARVHAHSQGNPFYVERLLEHLVTTGRITWTKGHWNTAATWSEADLPVGTSGLLAAQIAGLPPEARVAIQAASVLGDSFDLDLLQAVTDLTDERLFDAVDALVRSQMVVRDDAGRYAFAQDQFAELVLADLTLADRQAVHGAALRALDARFRDVTPEDLSLDALTALARHAIAADAPAATVVYAASASKRLAQLYAHEQAAAFARAGLAALDVVGGQDAAERRLSLLETLGDVFRETGQWPAGLEVYREAIAIAEAQEREPARRSRLMCSLAKLLLMKHDTGDAIAICRRAAAICAEAGDLNGEVRARLTIAQAEWFQGERKAVVPLAEATVVAARSAASVQNLAQALGFLGLALVEAMPERREEGIARLREALALTEGLGDKIGLCNTYNYLGNALGLAGDQRGAREAFVEELRYASELGLVDDMAFANMNLGLTDYVLGDFEQAARWAAASEASAHHVASRFPHAGAVALGAAAGVPRGCFERLGAFNEAIAQAIDHVNPLLQTFIRQIELEALVRLGAAEQARASGDALAALVAKDGGEPASQAMCMRALVAAQAGALGEAKDLATGALALAREVGTGTIEAWALRAACEIGLLREDWEAARRDGEAAATLATGQGLAYLGAELDGLLGELALSTGRAADATHHFSAMAERCEASGYALLLPEAYFGQAAARPYDPTAAGLVERAKGLIDALAARLPADRQDAFLATRVRHRIATGNHIGFGLPRVRTRAPQPFLGSGPLTW